MYVWFNRKRSWRQPGNEARHLPYWALNCASLQPPHACSFSLPYKRHCWTQYLNIHELSWTRDLIYRASSYSQPQEVYPLEVQGTDAIQRELIDMATDWHGNGLTWHGNVYTADVVLVMEITFKCRCREIWTTPEGWIQSIAVWAWASLANVSTGF